MVERKEAPSRGQSERGRWTKQAQKPLESSEDQRLVQAVPLLPKTQDAWRSFGQRDRRVRSAVLTWADAHSVLSCTRKGSSPEIAGSVELQLPLPMALRIPPNGTPIRRWQHIIAKRFCMFACPGTGSKADFQAKMDNWGRSTRTVPMCRLKCKKKNGKWDRLTANRDQFM